MLVLYVQDDLEQGLAALGCTQAITNVLAIEHAGYLAQQFQMSIGGRNRNQQNEKQVHGRAIDRVIIDGGVKVQKGADR